MSRRKRKPQSIHELPPSEQHAIQDAQEPIALPVETHAETETSESSIELQDEIENFPSPAIPQNAIDSPSSPVETQPEAEKPAPPAVTLAHKEPPAPASADRRTHPRYAFTAAIHVVAAEADARIKTRVSDLSQQGCYVDTEHPLPLGTTAAVRMTKGSAAFEAQARVVSNQPGKGMGLVFTAIEPEQLGTLGTWISESRETSWLAANRRRSQRVLMKIPVRVSGQVGSAPPFQEEAHTLAISAHGALIVLTGQVYRGQRLTLSNIHTEATIESVVAHIDKFQGQQIQVGVEFMLPNPTFWRVAFPPKDWSPRHPHAKSR